MVTHSSTIKAERDEKRQAMRTRTSKFSPHSAIVVAENRKAPAGYCLLLLDLGADEFTRAHCSSSRYGSNRPVIHILLTSPSSLFFCLARRKWNFENREGHRLCSAYFRVFIFSPHSSCHIVISIKPLSRRTCTWPLQLRGEEKYGCDFFRAEHHAQRGENEFLVFQIYQAKCNMPKWPDRIDHRRTFNTPTIRCDFFRLSSS